jgi:hypothetical protein
MAHGKVDLLAATCERSMPMRSVSSSKHEATCALMQSKPLAPEGRREQSITVAQVGDGADAGAREIAVTRLPGGSMSADAEVLATPSLVAIAAH